MDVHKDSDERPAARFTWSWLKIAVAVFILFSVCVLAIFLYINNKRSQLREQVQTELASIRAAGYPVNLKELDDWYVQVPPEENAAIPIIEAVHRIRQGWIEKDPSDTTMSFKTTDLPANGEPISEDVRKRLLLILEKTADVRQMIHSASKKTKARYPIDLTKGLISYGHDGPEAGFLLTEYLEFEAIMATDDGRINDAIDAIEAVMWLARSTDSAPVDMAVSARIHFESTATDLTERLMSRRQLSAKQLFRLGEMFGKATAAPQFERAVAGSCAWISTMILDFETIHGPVDDQKRFWFAAGNLLGRPERMYLATSPYLRKYIEASSLGSIDRVRRFQEIDEERDRSPDKERLDVMLGLFTMVAEREAKHCLRVQVTYGALVIEQYRAAHGKLPPDLAALVPEFCKEVPQDLSNNKPLIYKPLAKGFTIYSVGGNGVDDGGTGDDFLFTVAR